MLTAFVKFGDGHTMRCTDSADLSTAYNDPSAQFWLDLSGPTETEYALLKDLFGFHPLAVEDAIHEVQRPKLESYALVGDKLKTDYFFLVIHGPDLDPDPNNLFHTTELDIFFSQRYLVTVHDDPMAAVSEMFARVQTLHESKLTLDIDILLYELLDRLMDKYVPIIDDFQELLDKLEEVAITDPPPEFLVTVSDRKTELLNLRRIMTQQRDILGQLTRGEVPFMGSLSRIYFRDVLDHLNREVETIDIYRESVDGLPRYLHVEYQQSTEQDHEDTGNHQHRNLAPDGDYKLLRNEFCGHYPGIHQAAHVRRRNAAHDLSSVRFSLSFP